MFNLLDIMNYDEYKRDEDEDFITEGEKPGRGYFDASLLDDAPARQLTANGSEVFVLHIAFASHKDLLRAIKALSNLQRSYISASSHEVSFKGTAMMKDDTRTFLEHWEEKLLGIKAPKRKRSKKSLDEDEAYEPLPF